MAYGGGAAAGAAAAAAAIANAIKASGAIIKLDPGEFTKIVQKIEEPLVVQAQIGVFTKKMRYLTCYKGLYFYCQTSAAIPFSARTEYVNAKSIWIPG
jgi:hypothetical protein